MAAWDVWCELAGILICLQTRRRFDKLTALLEIGPKSIIDHVEEYGLLVVIGIAVLYYLYTRVKKGYEAVAYEMKSRKAEDAIRRAREAQQARYWEETAEKREELERIERERRANKLEDMEAMAEGRTSKAKKTLKVPLFPSS
jgi:hypothetical protein